MPVIESSNNIAVQEYLEDYAAQLAKDPVGNVHSIVAACRTSGQCQWDLTKTIKEGNAAGKWKDQLPQGMENLPVVQLLRDCETRWSSTYLMIERLILLYPVCSAKFQCN